MEDKASAISKAETRRWSLRPHITVTNSGNIFHYDGNSWSPMTVEKPTDRNAASLYGIWGNSETGVFAVGDGGTILHYSGPVSEPPTIFLPIVSKAINRVCPGGPGSSPTLSNVSLSPNWAFSNSTVQLLVQFTFGDPNGDLDNGAFNWIAPSGQTVSITLPNELAGVIGYTVSGLVTITTDNQKGMFKIPTWLVDKAGNCSNIVFVDWSQY